MSEAKLEAKVIEALRTCYDPEIPVNIYDLGLIYGVDVQPGGRIHVRMTLTAPNCPVAGTLPKDVEAKVKNIPGVNDVNIELVWEPAWDRAKMSAAARLELGFDIDFDVVPTPRLR